MECNNSVQLSFPSLSFSHSGAAPAAGFSRESIASAQPALGLACKDILSGNICSWFKPSWAERNQKSWSFTSEIGALTPRLLCKKWPVTHLVAEIFWLSSLLSQWVRDGTRTPNLPCHSKKQGRNEIFPQPSPNYSVYLFDASLPSPGCFSAYIGIWLET